MNADERRASFRELHGADRLFVMPNPWDLGSARLLETLGFEALATTSQGYAWALGKLDYGVTRDELVAHVRGLSASTSLPLNVDSADCYPDDPGGIAETVRLLAEAGAAGCSIEDFDPVKGLVDIDLAAERVAIAAEAAHGLRERVMLTGRAENHIRGVDDLDDTIARLLAYRDAGADCLYAPGLTDIEHVRRVVEAVGSPVNVLALPSGPPIDELASAGVRRVSTGSQLAGAAYGAFLKGARELLEAGTSGYAEAGFPRDLLTAAFGPASGA